MFVGAPIKYIKIQNIEARPYIFERLHVKLDLERTDRTITNTNGTSDKAAVRMYRYSRTNAGDNKEECGTQFSRQR